MVGPQKLAYSEKSSPSTFRPIDYESSGPTHRRGTTCNFPLCTLLGGFRQLLVDTVIKYRLKLCRSAPSQMVRIMIILQPNCSSRVYPTRQAFLRMLHFKVVHQSSTACISRSRAWSRHSSRRPVFVTLASRKKSLPRVQPFPLATHTDRNLASMT